MGIKSKIKKNVVLTNLSNMKVTVAGRPKSGKTSLFYEILKREGGLDSGLLIAFEKGYNFLEGVNVVDISSWKEFVDLLGELEKDNEGFKYVGVDTIDVANQLCQDFVIKRASTKDGKRYETLADIPYGGGYALLEKEFSTQYSRLERVFGGWWSITHDKDKDFEERGGMKYTKTTMSTTGKVGDYIKNSSDFIVFIDIVKEKVRDKETRQTILQENRQIRFRGDGTTEAGGRITELPETIPYDVDLFLDTIETAVKNQVSSQTKEIAKSAKSAKKVEVTKKTVNEPEPEPQPVEDVSSDIDDVKAQISDVVSGMKSSEKREVAKVFKEKLGVVDFKKSDDLEALKEVLEEI